MAADEISSMFAKNNKCDIKRRNAAVLLMYFPCPLTAKLLKRCMFKDASGKARGDQQSDSDVLMETRGRRGFVYPGYSALPLWEDTKPIADVMCDKKWDILAFKEALKCIHGFELKMTERVEEKEAIQKRIDYMEGKSTQKPKKVGDEDDETLFVLKGDARYDLLMKLLDEIKADVGMDEDGEYSLFVRALRGWDGLREKWIDNPRNAEGECAKQEKGGKLGSAVLFKRLCTDKYRFIWEGRPATEKQADDILCAYAALQQLRQKVKCLEEPVHITAAEPIFSPRALTYSDWDSSKKTGIFGAEEEGRIDLPVLVHGTQNKLKKQIVRAWFAAPSLKRDELGVNLGKWMSEKKCDWLQPMMSALGVEEKVKLKKKAAVTLALGISDQAKAPDLLLNFPVTLDVSHLREAIGKAKLWDKQFNGVTSEKLHLHWPSSNPALQNAWWNKTDVKENGFIVLGIDLGVRSGSAYSVVKVRSGRDKQGMKTKSGKVYQGRFLGETDGEPWYGYAVKQGILRMDGEGGKFCVARKPIPEEMKLLQRLRCKVDMTPGAWPINTVWDVQKEALYGFRMYLSRFRRYVWCANHLRQEQSIQWDKLEKYLSRASLYGIGDSIQLRDKKRVLSLLDEEIEKMRGVMPGLAEEVTGLLLPRKRGKWHWQTAEEDEFVSGGTMELIEEPVEGKVKQKISQQGGLSMRRINALEDLRRCLQSMSRLLAETKNGLSMKGEHVKDPCPMLLEKINRMREQRVNQIAHDIVAQALGVRLMEPKDKSGTKRDTRIYHGEYEKIPDRSPVDFVVMENLSRYCTSVDRPREENSQLMQWCHRQIVLKVVQMLEEVFGIPVLMTHAAYTSKFDCMTSSPGFRAQEMTRERLAKEAQNPETDEDRKMLNAYLKLLEELQILGNKRNLLKKTKLLMPHPSNAGEYFVSKFGDALSVRQADINAATNIAWRGIASPEALELLHRLRLKRKGVRKNEVRLAVRYDNDREKALKKCKTEIQNGDDLTAFYAGEAGETFLVKVELSSARALSFVGAKAFWSKVKDSRWELCHHYNYQILRKIFKEDELKHVFSDVR